MLHLVGIDKISFFDETAKSILPRNSLQTSRHIVVYITVKPGLSLESLPLLPLTFYRHIFAPDIFRCLFFTFIVLVTFPLNWLPTLPVADFYILEQ